jgi:hypothetical protein
MAPKQPLWKSEIARRTLVPPSMVMNFRRLMGLPQAGGRNSTTFDEVVVRHSKIRRSTSGMGLGRAKTSVVAPHVEISPSNCISESQIILHTRDSMPCWRIVFSTFRGCMSFYTARVKSGKARCEHIPSGLPPRADIVNALWHFRFVPGGDLSRCSNVRHKTAPIRSPRRCGRAE